MYLFTQYRRTLPQEHLIDALRRKVEELRREKEEATVAYESEKKIAMEASITRKELTQSQSSEFRFVTLQILSSN